MDPIIIAVIIILCQYPMAILTLFKLFKIKLGRTEIIAWDVAIVALPFVGLTAFWLAYLIKYRKMSKPTEASKAPVSEESKKSEENNKTNE